LPIERGLAPWPGQRSFRGLILADHRDGDMVSRHLVKGGKAPWCWRIIAYLNTSSAAAVWHRDLAIGIAIIRQTVVLWFR
jgi:hypothetical protein